MTNGYDDIINLPHHVSPTRPQMSIIDRAAQFAPFAALTGFGAAIREAGRLTDEKIGFDEESLTALNIKFQVLFDRLDENPEVTFVYFKPDERKAGGTYLRRSGIVKKIRELERQIILMNDAIVPMDEIIDIEAEIFADFL